MRYALLAVLFVAAVVYALARVFAVVATVTEEQEKW